MALKKCFRCKEKPRHRQSYCFECSAIINRYHNQRRAIVKEVLATKSNEVFINSKEDLERLANWRNTCGELLNSKDYSYYIRGKILKEHQTVNQFLKHESRNRNTV
jgi:hypothetical protein